MKPTDDQHHASQGSTERLPNLTINHLFDEVLLDIFDFYRQGIDSYDHQWREKYVWLNLAHVCRKWRTVMLGSISRLELGIVLGCIIPDDIETILSGPWPIFIDYKCMFEGITSNALWRMRSALEQRDRVRGISFEGSIDWFGEFFSATNSTFPILESLVLRFRCREELELPDTFLGGPDLSNLHLRRLKLERISLASVFRFLSSASSLTDLSLRIETEFDTSPETPLLACLQGMPCLSRLDLSISVRSPPRFPAPQDIVPLSKLMYFRYTGHSIFLDAIVAGLSAPFLQEFSMEFFDEVLSPIVHLTRFINEMEEHYRAVHVTFHERAFCLSLLTQSNFSRHRLRSKQSRIPRWSPESIMRMSGSLSTKLNTVEELCVTFNFGRMAAEDYILWRRFYQLFPSVKVFRTKGTDCDCVAYTLLQDHEEPEDVLTFFPALEEIELGDQVRDGDFRIRHNPGGSLMAGFPPFISARQRAGRPVNVFSRP